MTIVISGFYFVSMCLIVLFLYLGWKSFSTKKEIKENQEVRSMNSIDSLNSRDSMVVNSCLYLLMESSNFFKLNNIAKSIEREEEVERKATLDDLETHIDSVRDWGTDEQRLKEVIKSLYMEKVQEYLSIEDHINHHIRSRILFAKNREVEYSSIEKEKKDLGKFRKILELNQSRVERNEALLKERVKAFDEASEKIQIDQQKAELDEFSQELNQRKRRIDREDSNLKRREEVLKERSEQIKRKRQEVRDQTVKNIQERDRLKALEDSLKVKLPKGQDKKKRKRKDQDEKSQISSKSDHFREGDSSDENKLSHPLILQNDDSQEKPVESSLADDGDILLKTFSFDIKSDYHGHDYTYYPQIVLPKKGSIIRTHSYGVANRRGYKERDFQYLLEQYFGKEFEITGNAFLATGSSRPYEPDIALIDNSSGRNLRIDIEIDEPYAGISRKPIHIFGEDVLRDYFFTDRGWSVIRFSEFQVHTQADECIQVIADLINTLLKDANYEKVSEDQILVESKWDLLQAQIWEKENYRENYLGHEFGVVEEEYNSQIKELTEQEKDEEAHVDSSIEIVNVETSQGYNANNRVARDDRIKFIEDTHRYLIDNAEAISVTTLVDKYFNTFDREYWANRKAEERGVSLDSILNEWETTRVNAANLGTRLHSDIEAFYLNNEISVTPEFEMFQDFQSSHNFLIPFRSEWRIFDENYLVAGTIDLVAKNNGRYEIYDWKRSKKVISDNGVPINTSRFRTGIGLVNNIADTSYNKYCIQQNIYKYILEQNYNLEIDNMFLVVLHPKYPNYCKLEIPDMSDLARKIIRS